MIKKSLYFLIALILTIVICVAYPYFFSRSTNINKASAEMTVSAEKLASSFISNQKKANKNYINKVIQVNGIIKEITFLNKTNTIILQSEHENFGVLCDMQLDATKDHVQKLVKGQKVTIKGICKGFLHDVILLNCILINTKNNE